MDINEIRRKLMYFNVEDYLRNKHIPYSDEGKNVAPGWIGVKCPFCPSYDPDPGTHLGINKNSNNISCWRCPTKGTVLKFIMKTERTDINNAVGIIDNFSNTLLKRQNTPYKPSHQHIHDLTLPITFTKNIGSMQESYIRGRGFNPDYLYEKHNLYSSGPVGDYRYRIIAPIFFARRMVSFTTRDVTDQAEQPHLSLMPEESIIPPKHTLYNLDSVSDTAIIVEGLFDTWNMGDGTCATLGLRYTAEQVHMLVMKRLKRAFIMFDAKGEEMAKALAYDLTPFVPHVETITLPEGDPGELSQVDVNFFRKELLGKVY